MKEAANLQMLLAALAFKYIISGRISHDDIPSTPFIENERRQILFGAAIGASVGFYLTPLAIVCYNQQLENFGETLPLLPVMASLAIAYLIGEGIGRLACISFRCCYGKPVSEMGTLSQRIFSRFSVSFHGDTKKIVYASGRVQYKKVATCFNVTISGCKYSA